MMYEDTIRIDNALYEYQQEIKTPAGRPPREERYKKPNWKFHYQRQRNHDPYGPQAMEIDNLVKGNRGPSKNGKDGKKKIRCYNCDIVGHMAKDCRKKKNHENKVIRAINVLTKSVKKAKEEWEVITPDIEEGEGPLYCDYPDTEPS